MIKTKLAASVFVALTLTACGGGGGGSSTPAPTAPAPVQDTQRPNISFTGGTAIQVNQGDSFDNPTPTITDNVDSGLSASITGTVESITK